MSDIKIFMVYDYGDLIGIFSTEEAAVEFRFNRIEKAVALDQMDRGKAENLFTIVESVAYDDAKKSGYYWFE